MKIKFNRFSEALIPVVVQDDRTHKVLTQGFMDKKSLKKSLKTSSVVFYTDKKFKSQNGENENRLEIAEIKHACDNQSILIKARPVGAVCHKGKGTCFGEKNERSDFLYELERFVKMRQKKPAKSSLTSRMLARGRSQIAKKLGEEAVELVIEAVETDNDELLKAEASDLLYYVVLLLAERGVELEDVIDVLEKRRR